MVRAPVLYTTTFDGLDIAYQVLGDGPIDVVVAPGLYSNLDRNPDYPFYGGYFRRLPRFARAIFLDRRGAGLSDRDLGSGSPEDRMDDIRSVLDAVGSKRTALIGQADGGAIAILFAATYPERVSSLVLLNAPARIPWAPDYPDGYPADQIDGVMDWLSNAWGRGLGVSTLTADAPDDNAAIESLAMFERSIGTPAAIRRQLKLGFTSDVRSALALIEAPTLVIYSPGSTPFVISLIRYVADHIRGARFVELPYPHSSWDTAKQDACIDVIEEFLTGHRPQAADVDRVLATVLFTDIVGSTARAAALGDRRWRDMLDTHDRQCAAEVDRFRGRVVKHTGDGLLAVFDGPARAIRCAHAIIAAGRTLGLEVRAGLHTGEVEQRAGDVSGLALHIAARIVALAGASEAWVSATVRDLVVGSGLQFDERGEHSLRGVEGTWRLLAARPPA
jgi:class 3 adenylate cyclase